MISFEEQVLQFWDKVKGQYEELTRAGNIAENTDYYVFQTAYKFKPDLMIVGLNPGGNGKDGAGWLCPPENRNMYVEGDHPWFDRLRKIFGYPTNEVLKPYLENCVGSNNYFLNTGNQDKLPKSSLLNGEFIKELVFDIVRPKKIVALGKKIPYDTLRTTKSITIEVGQVYKTSSNANGIPILYIPNPSPRNNTHFEETKFREWQTVLEDFLAEPS